MQPEPGQCLCRLQKTATKTKATTTKTTNNNNNNACLYRVSTLSVQKYYCQQGSRQN